MGANRATPFAAFKHLRLFCLSTLSPCLSDQHSGWSNHRGKVSNELYRPQPDICSLADLH